jgi:hypothetical protein
LTADPIGRSTDDGGPGEVEASSRGGGVVATLEARKVKQLRLNRMARGAVIALAVALVWAAPAAAAQPTRTVLHPTGGSHPAGQGCPFDISYVDAPGARITVTDFSDGREVSDVHAIATFTNDDNGKTFVHKAFYHAVDLFDAGNGVWRSVVDGQSVAWFYPGDIGPYGIVGADGLALRIVGTIWVTWDPNANAVTEFAYVGTVTSVCDLLS